MTEHIYIPDLPNKAIHRTELIIKRSKFITSIGHTAGIEKTEEFLDSIRAEYKDARHNCYAFNAGKANTTSHIGCSDDGEPKGTAGQPMLNVVTHCGIGEITIVVTRYFGGILLGTGGLVKAYQDSVKLGLESLPTKIYEAMSLLTFKINVALMNQIINICKKNGISILESNFVDEQVVFVVDVPVAKVSQFSSTLVDISKGKVEIID